MSTYKDIIRTDPISRSLIVSLIAVGMFAPLSESQAFNSLLTDWEVMYPNSLSVTNLVDPCSLCHTPNNISHLNAYGWALAQNGSNFEATESLNSDNDPTDATNLEEINANTQPGWTTGPNNIINGGNVSINALPPAGTNGELDPSLTNQPPSANAGGPYSGTQGIEVTFDGSASSDMDGNIVEYAWDFGDTSNGYGVIASHTYQDNGTYTLTLTVTDDAGDSDTDTTSITIGAGNQAPTADPNGPYTGSAGVEVAFDAGRSTDSDGSIVSYDWDFGDGSSGTGITTRHTYDTQGTYNLMLTVTDDNGATDSASTSVTIDPVNQAPVANAGAPYSANVGDELLFDGSGSSDSDGSIVSYEWDFGDGTNGSGTTPSHIYTDTGSYNVSLTVTDNGGLSHTDNTSATIGEVINQPPVADANGPYVGTLEQALSFDATASSDPDGRIISYEWDFGDGQTATGPNPDHTYNQAGNYNVTLTVTDNNGVNDSDTTTATIGSGNLAPVADAGGPYNGSVGREIPFNGSASSDPDGSIVSYLWNFGDGNESVLMNPSHSYAEPGTYNVTLTVYDDYGAADANSISVVIAPLITKADVYLAELWVRDSIHLLVGHHSLHSAIALGQGTEVPQGATVRLSATVPNGIHVRLRNDSMTHYVGPNHLPKLYWFSASITCEAAGRYNLSFSATISGNQNSDRGNDTLSTETLINCHDYPLHLLIDSNNSTDNDSKDE